MTMHLCIPIPRLHHWGTSGRSPCHFESCFPLIIGSYIFLRDAQPYRSTRNSFPHSPKERAVFKSLSDSSSDPRRHAEAPVVTYSALSKRNLAPSYYRTRFVPDALLVKELNRASQQQQLRRMEVYAASRRDLANAIQSYNDNDSITSSSNRLHWVQMLVMNAPCIPRLNL